MSPEFLTDDEKLSLACWQSYRDRLFYRTAGEGSYWAWASVVQLDLNALILQFGKYGPGFFQLELYRGHLALQVFGDVALIGIGQITEQSWSSVWKAYAACHQGATDDLRLTAYYEDETVEAKVEVQDVTASVH